MLIITIRAGLTRQEAEQLAQRLRDTGRVAGIFHDGRDTNGPQGQNGWAVEATPRYT